MRLFARIGLVLCAIAAASCQDVALKDAIPSIEQSQGKKYSRSTVEEDGTGAAVSPGSSGDPIEAPPPMKVHEHVRFKTVLKDKDKANELNPKERSYPEHAGDPAGGHSFSYTGPCTDSKWMQFVWKTHYYDGDSTKLANGTYNNPPPHDADGGRQKIPATQGNYVTDPNASDPATHLDTAAPDSPYYNAEAGHSDDNKTMYDTGQPGDVKDVSKSETVVYHFSTFLICDGKVAYHLKFTKTFQRKVKEASFGIGKLEVQDAGPGGKLSDSEKKELNTRFSNAPVPTPQ